MFGTVTTKDAVESYPPDINGNSPGGSRACYVVKSQFAEPSAEIDVDVGTDIDIEVNIIFAANLRVVGGAER